MFGIEIGTIYTWFRSLWRAKNGVGKVVMTPRPSSSSCFQFASFLVARRGRARRSSRHKIPPRISEAAFLSGFPILPNKPEALELLTSWRQLVQNGCTDIWGQMLNVDVSLAKLSRRGP